MTAGKGQPTLRDRHAAATKDEILDTAMNMLGSGDYATFSHESIAAAAGMGARTVYRHFPDRGQLLQALWIRLRDDTNTRFPAREDEIVGLTKSVFHEFDQHETLVRAVLNSAAGTEVRERGGAEGRPAFSASLGKLLDGRTASERARIIAVFVAIYSAPFWQLLRDRGGLSGPESQQAAAWLMETLLDALRKTKPKTRNESDRTNKKKR
jgi:AcrR family transcriptional regulator